MSQIATTGTFTQRVRIRTTRCVYKPTAVYSLAPQAWGGDVLRVRSLCGDGMRSGSLCRPRGSRVGVRLRLRRQA